MTRYLTVAAALVALLAAAVAAEPTPSSIKEDFKEIGRDIEDTSKKVYEKAKDGTTHGVGTALEKTGEGFDKAADGLDHAGQKVKEQGSQDGSEE